MDASRGKEGKRVNNHQEENMQVLYDPNKSFYVQFLNFKKQLKEPLKIVKYFEVTQFPSILDSSQEAGLNFKQKEEKKKNVLRIVNYRSLGQFGKAYE